ncbi:MAG: 3-hydroxyacyl-CoA dehydrogenase NAD-binding domain-containing protein [Actinomycetota bacterium]
MAEVNDVTSLDVEDGVAVITLDSPPVNALSAAVRDGLYQGFEAAIADPDARAIVLICAGRTFIAGADISEFGGQRKGAELPEVQTLMESSPKPVVAAIHGTALGGGLEVALCAHQRVAVPSARCGLPEVHLGLLPGAGGTQRLPRIAGPARALDMMLSGEHVLAHECLDMGLVDALTGEDSLRADAIAHARRMVDEGADLTKISDRPCPPATDDELDAVRAKHRKGFRGFLAPSAIDRCVTAAMTLPFAEGMAVERAEFGPLVTSPESAAQRHLFFAERQVWKIPDLPKGTEELPIAKVGIVGAGTMGGGIAMNFANVGIPVTLVETQAEALDRGLGVVRANYDRSARRGRFTEAQVEERMGRLSGSLDLADLADVDLVIEAVFEDMDVKKSVFGRLDEICRPGAILATNTSALDIDEIAASTSRPESVIGLHFFSPANVMRFLEVVRADRTAPEVIATSMSLAKRIGKLAALVGVCPGFTGNRMLFQRSTEANQLLADGVMPWDIDAAVEGFGFAMGPFRMSDLAGLDLGWRRETSTGSTVRERLCEIDRRGQKNGAGFYDYDADRTPSPSTVTEAIVTELAERSGRPKVDLSAEEIVERCLLPMVNEGAKILGEGMAIRPSDIDVMWVHGYNWPAYRGGPMWWGDHQGLDRVLARLGELGDGSPRWQPAPLIERLVAEGRGFASLKPNEAAAG